MSGELTELYLALLDFIEPLRTRLEEPDALEYLFYRYGWDAVMDDAAFARIQQTATIIAPIEQFATTAEALRPKLAVGSLDAADIEALGQSAATLIRALAAFSLPDLSGLADPFGRADFWESIAEQVFDDLLEQYLRVYQPVIFLVLRLWNVIRYDLTSPAGPGRVSYTRVWFDWAQASSMMTSPLQALEQAYHWGDPAQPFDYEQALAALQLVFQAIRVPAALFAPALATAAPPGDSNQAARDDVLALRMTLLERDFPAANAFYQLGLEIFPAAKSTDQVPTGLMLKPVLEGGASTTLPLNNLFSFTLATAVSADDVIGLAIFPDHTGLVGGAPSIGTSLSLQTTGTGPWYALGTKTSSHIELSGFLLQASIAGSLDDPEIKLQAGFADSAGQPGCTAVVLLSDADPFVQGTVNGSALKFAFSPQIAWSSKTGLLFSGKPTISFDLPLSIALGPISLTDVTLALAAPPQATPAPGAQATPAKGVAVRIGVGVTGTLGPVKVAVSQLGFTCLITPYSRDDVRALPPGAAAPALGAVDVDLQFAPPTGVGLSIDAGVVTGGGFLEHSGDEYAGALDLSLEGMAVKAYGLIQTKLPSGQPGYSFIAVISAEFQPAIELPFGFSLDGVGGLIGINRSISQSAIETALWAHHLDGLLFPKDPVASAPQLLSALDTYFPATPGRYIIGPLVKIGWSANLVVGELAVLFELPEPLKILLIGDIQVNAPTVKPQLVLHISFDGGIDFGAKLAFFDASLHDSKIAGYPISGDLAFRYGWGDDAVFALALGGFNPQFQPPASFPTLKRLAISIGSSVAKLDAQAYFALTSNTLQFGARVELTAGTGGFNVHGWLGFDALLEKDPLSFEFDLTAGVDLRSGSSVLASVHLDGKLSGPTPWHISGEASLSLLFFDVSVHFDQTWGSVAGPATLPDPLAALTAALADRSGWSGLATPGVRAAISPAGTPSDAGDAVLLDPAGALRIAQRAVPLDQPITRFGGVSLGRTVTFSVDSLTAFGQSAASLDTTTAASLDTTTEEFAPAQFLDLTDAEKLSLPSFSRFDAGVELGIGAVDLGHSGRSRAVLTPIVYDTTIIDSLPPLPTPPTPPPYRLGLAAALALNGSVGRLAPGLGRYAPAPGTPPRVALAADQWVVASTTDLGHRADIASDGTKLGAHLALQQYLAANPGEAGGLQIVLASEAG
jgi:hypothetical protein